MSTSSIDPFAQLSVRALVRLIATKEVSPVKLLENTLERISARNPSLNALVFVDADGARLAAHEAERSVLRGDALGVLHGVPTVLKDLFDFNPGWPTTFGGVRAFRDNVTQLSCNYARRMRQAGAILIGKTNSPVMGFRGTCDNPLFGPTRNPFDLALNAGGSSGGSAAAVADGLVAMAEATDGGGSIRIPAAWCGVFGYKASFGVVPQVRRPNAFGAVNPFHFEGVVTRNVADAALAMSVLAGYDARDPFSIDRPVDWQMTDLQSMEGVRIAYCPGFGGIPVQPSVAAMVADAVTALADAGARVDLVEVPMPAEQNELSDTWCRLSADADVEFFDMYKNQGLDLLSDHRADFPTEYLQWLHRVARRTVQDLARDQRLRTEVYDSVEHVFNAHDFLVTPTVACTPVPNATDNNTLGPTVINGISVNPLIGWCLTYLINFTGHPAVSVPAGLVDGRLPVGMQIIGRRYQDAALLAAAATFEQVKPWDAMYRLCESRPL